MTRIVRGRYQRDLANPRTDSAWCANETPHGVIDGADDHDARHGVSASSLKPPAFPDERE